MNEMPLALPAWWPIRLAGQIFLGRKYFCVACRREAEGFRDKLSAAEFRQSGLCQHCQDGVFGQ